MLRQEVAKRCPLGATFNVMLSYYHLAVLLVIQIIPYSRCLTHSQCLSQSLNNIPHGNSGYVWWFFSPAHLACIAIPLLVVCSLNAVTYILMFLNSPFIISGYYCL